MTFKIYIKIVNNYSIICLLFYTWWLGATVQMTRGASSYGSNFFLIDSLVLFAYYITGGKFLNGRGSGVNQSETVKIFF